ncbi:Tim44 domain-containing protein [Pseudoalteromonas sp. SSDWG2]|uniref:Tim44 domain-containing protein n=1 Tax=Pseudoalteromonas sp. SSDWG2 TaxID=3139391 RepID=UPI003BABDCF3
MKYWVLVFTLLSVLLTASFDAQARKKFGAKRTGKTEQTQTTQQQQPTDTTSVVKKTTPKKGIMGGILGGLLAGGLIAAMLGDDFEGIQLLEILLFAGIGFMLFKLITNMMRKQHVRPAMASAHGAHYQAPERVQSHVLSNSVHAQSIIPMDLPPHFDERGFLNAAKDHYVTIQRAWNNSDFNVIAQYLCPELVDEFQALRAEQGEVKTEVLFVDARIVRASTSPTCWAISVHFSGQYFDQVENAKEPINEIWHLERKNSADAPWLIVGTEDLV